MKTTNKLLALIAFAFSSAASANQNIYASLSAGIFQADFANTYLDQTGVIPENISQPAFQNGYIGTLAVGYRYLFPLFFTGVELAASSVGQQAVFQSGAAASAFADKMQINYFADLTFVPGINLAETIMAYLKLGLSFAAVQDQINSPTGFDPVYVNYNSRKNVLGFAAGLGVAKALNDHASIFTEAGYHDYGTVTFKDFANFTANYSHTAHIYSYDLAVGASYKFDV